KRPNRTERTMIKALSILLENADQHIAAQKERGSRLEELLAEKNRILENTEAGDQAEAVKQITIVSSQIALITAHIEKGERDLKKRMPALVLEANAVRRKAISAVAKKRDALRWAMRDALQPFYADERDLKRALSEIRSDPPAIF